jgi:hypothetical protein
MNSQTVVSPCFKQFTWFFNTAENGLKSRQKSCINNKHECGKYYDYGTTVRNQTMTAVMGANAFDAHLQLPDGVYMLVVEQDGETSIQKSVIQK